MHWHRSPKPTSCSKRALSLAATCSVERRSSCATTVLRSVSASFTRAGNCTRSRRLAMVPADSTCSGGFEQCRLAEGRSDAMAALQKVFNPPGVHTLSALF
jgi:hypothetical protein